MNMDRIKGASVCVYATALMSGGASGVCALRGAEWQGSWIVMVDSCSLSTRLSVSQQTPMPALPVCFHTQIWKHTHVNTPSRRFSHTYTPTHRDFISPSSGPPVAAVERIPIMPFPQTAWVQHVFLPVSSHHSHWGERHTEYGNRATQGRGEEVPVKKMTFTIEAQTHSERDKDIAIQQEWQLIKGCFK